MPREKTPERLQVRELAPGSLRGIAGDIRPWRSVRRRGLSSGAGRGAKSAPMAAAEAQPLRDEASVVVPLRKR
jgi:hypothetical protein